MRPWDISARYCKLPRARSGQQRTAGPARFDDLAASAEKLPGAFLLPVEQQIWRHNADTVTRRLSSTDIAVTSGFQTSIAQPTAVDKARIRHTSSWEKVHSDMKCKRSQGFETQEQIPCFLTPPWR